MVAFEISIATLNHIVDRYLVLLNTRGRWTAFVKLAPRRSSPCLGRREAAGMCAHTAITLYSSRSDDHYRIPNSKPASGMHPLDPSRH